LKYAAYVNWDYGSRDPSHWPRGTFYPQKLALTSPTSGSCSVGIVRSRTQATEFSPCVKLCGPRKIVCEQQRLVVGFYTTFHSKNSRQYCLFSHLQINWAYRGVLTCPAPWPKSFFVLWSGRPLTGLLYQPGMMDEYGAAGAKRTGRGNSSTLRKSAQVPHCLQHIPHDLTWDRTHAAEVESWWLSIWAMAWSGGQSDKNKCLICNIIWPPPNI
jgi:hypothetical protein